MGWLLTFSARALAKASMPGRSVMLFSLLRWRKMAACTTGWPSSMNEPWMLPVELAAGPVAQRGVGHRGKGPCLRDQQRAEGEEGQSHAGECASKVRAPAAGGRCAPSQLRLHQVVAVGPLVLRLPGHQPVDVAHPFGAIGHRHAPAPQPFAAEVHRVAILGARVRG